MLLSAWLATNADSNLIKKLEEFDAKKIEFLEKHIDEIDCKLDPLKSFIIPGGHISSSIAHIARTVCRRAERHVLKLFAKNKEIYGKKTSYNNIKKYLNRLSDYLFVYARYCNKIHENL